MTAEEWEECNDPERLVHGFLESPLGRDVSELSACNRKLRLFACACCRELWDLLPDIRSRKAVAVAENLENEDVLDIASAAREARQARASTAPRIDNAFYTIPKWEAARLASMLLFENRESVTALDVVAPRFLAIGPTTKLRLFREIVGNPFVTRHLPEVPQNRDVMNVARDAYRRRAFDGNDLPILADALEDAGYPARVQCYRCNGQGWKLVPRRYDRDWAWCNCDEDNCIPNPVLEHLRSPGPHVLGCWALDYVLGNDLQVVHEAKTAQQ